MSALVGMRYIISIHFVLLHSYHCSLYSEIHSNLLLERGPQMCSIIPAHQQASFPYRPSGAIDGCCYKVLSGLYTVCSISFRASLYFILHDSIFLDHNALDGS